MRHDRIRRKARRPPAARACIIIEATSGNTGIALAFVAAAKGYTLILTMPETMSLERRLILKALGAHMVLTPGVEGMRGAVSRADQLARSSSEAWSPNQFENGANPAIHEATTGPELWEAAAGNIDIVIAEWAPAGHSPASAATCGLATRGWRSSRSSRKTRP
jgi:cysteine synthase A